MHLRKNTYSALIVPEGRKGLKRVALRYCGIYVQDRMATLGRLISFSIFLYSLSGFSDNIIQKHPTYTPPRLLDTVMAPERYYPRSDPEQAEL